MYAAIHQLSSSGAGYVLTHEEEKQLFYLQIPRLTIFCRLKT